MAQDGYPSSKLNLRDGKLAYWTGGADAGSTITVTEVSVPTRISDIDSDNNSTNKTDCYDLNGRKQKLSQSKGIFIVDGKKCYKK